MNAHFTPVLFGLTFLLGPVCCGDEAKGAGLNGVSSARVSAQPQAPCETPNRAIRWIDDPATHLRWILLKDPRHPAAPAVLAPMQSNSGCVLRSGENRVAVESNCFSQPAIPLIHGGETLIVEQHSAAADAQLEGTALGPAAIGEALRVRLKKSGKILSVIADGPGHATMPAGGSQVRW